MPIHLPASKTVRDKLAFAITEQFQLSSLATADSRTESIHLLSVFLSSLSIFIVLYQPGNCLVASFWRAQREHLFHVLLWWWLAVHSVPGQMESSCAAQPLSLLGQCQSLWIGICIIPLWPLFNWYKTWFASEATFCAFWVFRFPLAFLGTQLNHHTCIFHYCFLPSKWFTQDSGSGSPLHKVHTAGEDCQWRR